MNANKSKADMTEFKDKHISVIGAARSGMEAARVLSRLGANVLLSDSQTAQQLGVARVAQLEELDVPFVLGADLEAALPPQTELVVTSPGVPKTAPILQAAVQRSIPVWSEIELAFRVTSPPYLVAVTGTNGKTTTTLLVAHILEMASTRPFVAGNISADEIKRTLVEAAWEAEEQRLYQKAQNILRFPVIVAEISSFQLEWIERFRPHVAILTNITPDHLNRHTSFEEYAQTKARIFSNQREYDSAIINYDDPTARSIGQNLSRSNRIWFTQQGTPPDSGMCAWVQDGMITVRLGKKGTLQMGKDGPIAILPVEELPPTLPGTHSIDNVLAASAATRALGVPPEAIASAIRSFPGVAHRMEFVADVDKVRYINNSMCTNVAAADSSLRAMDRPTIAIMGGADKNLEYAPLVPALHEKAKAIVLIGQVADKMEAVFRAGGYTSIFRAPTLEAAVAQARSLAGPGEAVLLLPACASFDMFRDFEARGVAFRKAVHALLPLEASKSAEPFPASFVEATAP